MIRPQAAARLLNRIPKLRTLVVGDLMLDRFIWGSVTRISPEAPVPVVEVTRETEMAGGAGSVAVNMAALGSQVHLVGLVGQDATASALEKFLQLLSVPTGPAREASPRAS